MVKFGTFCLLLRQTISVHMPAKILVDIGAKTRQLAPRLPSVWKLIRFHTRVYACMQRLYIFLLFQRLERYNFLRKVVVVVIDLRGNKVAAVKTMSTSTSNHIPNYICQ